jgi:hypothetical protein
MRLASANRPDRTGRYLISSAREAFKGMSWDELKAHARGR